MPTRSIRSSIPAWLVLLGACSPDPARVCTPGASIACVGPGGCSGGQVCSADGSGYGACDCGMPGTDAGRGDDGGPPDAFVPAADAGTDAASDAGPTTCDPVTHAGCDAGERCTWVRIAMDASGPIGALRCVPDGTVAAGGACTAGPIGEETGYDDCARGLYCIDGRCSPVCAFADTSSCGTDAHCTRYAGVFANGEEDPAHGICEPTCDPVTQLLPGGGSCPSGQGCYVLDSTAGTSFVCARAGEVAIGATLTPPFFVNSCVPGGYPARRADGSLYCTAICRPVETHSGAPAGAAGVAPYACADRGAAAPPHECRFSWMFFDDTTDARLDTIGICFDRTGHLYDSNGDATPDAPMPSCTTLASTDTNGDMVRDHEYFGCAPPARP